MTLLDQTLQTLGQVLGYTLGATLVVVAPAVGALVVQAARYVTARLKLTLTLEQEQRLQAAAERGVLVAADRLRGTGQGAAKAELALKTAASLAPQAFGSLPPAAQEAIVQATYAKLRPSLQTPTAISTLPPGAMVSIPASSVFSVAPTLPPLQPAEGTTSQSGTYQPVQWPALDPATPRPRPSMPDPSLAEPVIPRPSAVPTEGARFVDADTRPETPRSKGRS